MTRMLVDPSEFGVIAMVLSSLWILLGFGAEVIGYGEASSEDRTFRTVFAEIAYKVAAGLFFAACIAWVIGAFV